MADPPYPGDGAERQLLERWLDFQRGAMLRKVEGLSDADARREMVPSGLSLLGLLKHVANDEHGWFHVVFAHETEWMIDDPNDPDADFKLDAGDSVASLTALYREICARSREIVASSSLDDAAKLPESDKTLRWIMIHMIEETARHAGHADIIREMIDGATGL